MTMREEPEDGKGRVSEYWNGEEWESADRCWGVAGEDDDADEVANADREPQRCATCGRLKARRL